MTHEEAIAELDKCKGNVEALLMAKEALEKQIPKKPMTQINDNERWLCPNCKTMIWMMFRFKYCPYCGQAIDWSEE